jgi:3-dehydroquinate dehydratase-2
MLEPDVRLARPRLRILLINGPNLGTLGRRQPEIYGTETLSAIIARVRAHAARKGASTDHFQSNHEGALIDRLEQLDYDAIVINPGALGHTSYALHDALVAAGRPVVEVHISDITKREPWRRISLIEPIARHRIVGHGAQGYIEAIDLLLNEDLEPPPGGQRPATS